MNIKETGYINFLGKECTYVQDNMTFFVIPVNKDNHYEITEYYKKKDFKVNYSTGIYNHSIISVKNLSSLLTFPGLQINANYIAKLLDDSPISQIKMIGDELDEFFNPLKHYYRQKQAKVYKAKDLLYSTDSVYKYAFNYNDSQVCIEVQYGNAFSYGIASDMKIHANVIISFEPTYNTDFVFDVIKIISKFVQFTYRIQDYNFKKNELYGITVGSTNLHRIGSLYEKVYIPNKSIAHSTMIECAPYNSCISNILQLIADEPNFPLSHLPHINTTLTNYSSPLRFAAIFAAFEYECSMDKDSFEISKTDIDKNFRNQIIDAINNVPTNCTKEKDFVINSKNRIQQLGTQYGQRKKIVNAFNNLHDYLDKSLQLLMPFDNNDIKTIAETLTNLRGSIVHGNMDRQFTEHEQSCIKVLDVIQFIMVLKRARLPIDKIDKILGQTYYINTTNIMSHDK